MSWWSSCTRFLVVGARRGRAARSRSCLPRLEHLEVRCVPTVSINEFAGAPYPGASPYDIVAGPDGNLWFTDFGANKIGRITPTGSVSEYSIPTPSSGPQGITLGPDGNLWFTEYTASKIGCITPTGTVSEYPVAAGSFPLGITAGPDGNLWFTESVGNQIGRITTTGFVTEYSSGLTPNCGPTDITAGPDGNLWFTEQGANQIGQITTYGQVLHEFSTGITANSGLIGITAGQDGNLWFVEGVANQIGRITTAGVVTEFSNGISANSNLKYITSGPDANLWFTEGAGRIGSITPTGTVTEYAMGVTPGSTPLGITMGPDANVWFTEFDGNRIGRVQGIPGATTVTLDSSDTAPVYGESVVFTATVTAQVASVRSPSSGVVIFRDGNRVLGGAALSGGLAVFSTDALSFGTHQVTASYSANDRYAGSTSAAVTEQVSAADTSTSIAGPIGTSIYGQAVTLTATVSVADSDSGATPAGAVGFYDGGTLLGTASLSGGIAVFSTTRLTAGDHPNITATYIPNANFLPSSSTASVDVQVTPAATSIAVSSASSSATAGQLVTYIATVSSTNSPATPAGFVTFLDGNVVLGTSTLSGGVAVVSTTPTLASDHSITASYTPTANFQGSSTTSPWTEHINAGALSGLVFGQQPTMSFINVPFNPTVTVYLSDAYGNLVKSTGIVTIRLASNPGAATLGGFTTVQAQNGVATFTGLYLTRKGTGFTLSATSLTLPGAVAVSNPFTISPTTHFSVTASPTSVKPGVGFNLTVSALDASGFLDTTYQGTVQITSNDPAAPTLLASYTFSASDLGKHTFTGLMLQTPGHSWTITVTDSRRSLVLGRAVVTVTGGAAPSLRHATMLTFAPDPVVHPASVFYLPLYPFTGWTVRP
jgi:streptogramin lyase